jgi:hypothetical protein
MSETSITWFERALAQVLGHFRTTEIEPLSRRLDALEQRQSLEKRIASLEARASGGPDAEAQVIDLPTNWRTRVSR